MKFSQQAMIDMFKRGASVETESINYAGVNSFSIVGGQELSYDLVCSTLPRRQWHVTKHNNIPHLVGVIPETWGVRDVE